MEIDVTEYVKEIDCSQFSNSIHKSGMQNIGQITWNNALQHVAVDGLVTSEQQEELRDWIREFGAWDDAEIAEMGDQETNALLLQFIAGDVQEMEHYDTLEEYEQAQKDGQVSGHLGRCDDDTWVFYVGS